MVKISQIKARKILNSKKLPTIEVELKTDSGRFLASVPSGTSKGKYEALERKAEIAIKNVNKIIAPRLVGKNPIHQKTIDEFLIKLDGTKNKSRLGANAILAISIAVLRAGAKSQNLPLWKWISKLAGTKSSLPLPSVLFIEGGLHGTGSLDIQEFMAVFPGKSFDEKLKTAMTVFHDLGKILIPKYGLEGAFSPKLNKTEDVLDLLMKVGKKKKIKIILDVAASYIPAKRRIRKTLEYYLDLVKEYPILGIEDPFPQDDWKNWEKLNSKLMIIGDDLTTTNVKRIKLAHRKRACRAVVIKPNQIGTVTETIQAAKLAKSFGWKTMVSHRSGETMDDFIADLAVGLGADFIKSGAPTQKERMVKYNRLLKIEQELCQS